MTPRKSEKEKADAKLLRAKKAGEDFIPRAKALHKEEDGTPLYDYSKSVYTKSAEKTTITCKIQTHGDFVQSPNSHLSGHGCPKCRDDANKAQQTMTHEEYIRRCEERYPNLLDFSKTKYVKWKEDATFICKSCHTEYIRNAGAMLGKGSHGCPKCIGGIRDTLESFIEKANNTHMNKYKYDLVVYVNAITKVNIKCPEGHIFEQTPNHHLNGDGCRKCHGHYRTQEEFIELSNTKFIDNPFIFTKLKFVNMGTPIILICPHNHEFIVSPQIHLSPDSKGGCKECQAEACSIRNSYTQQQWVELANGVHKNYYTYERTIYTGSGNKVIITCPEHGDFPQDPASHLSGCGCPICGIIASAEAKTYSEEDKQDIITELSKQYHNQYKYGKIFNDETGRLIIEVICELHDLFPQRLDHHRNGHGCSHCLNKTQSIVTEHLLTLNLNGEDKWLEWNPEWLINPETGYRYRFDNTLHLEKTISELDGLQHFIDGRWNGSNSDKNRSADIYKMKKAVENGYSGFRLFQPHILQNTFDWKQWIHDVLDIIKKSSLPIWVFPDNPIYEEHKKMCEKENIPYIIV